MRREEGFSKNLGSLFEEAYDIKSTPMMDSLRSTQEHFKDFEYYSEGGLKVIQLCHDCRSNRLVAMATLKDKEDPQKMEAFVREAKLNAALQHPNIVPVYEVGLDNEQPWFTMKFIAGKSLEEVINDLASGKDNEFSDLNNRLDAFIKICDAIAYAHSLGVLHLDIKPANIRLSEYGNVVVCDWGLADVISSICDESLIEYSSLVEYDLNNLTIDGTIKGTVGYMAPEQTSQTGVKRVFIQMFSLWVLFCIRSLLMRKLSEVKTLKRLLKKQQRLIFPNLQSLTVIFHIHLKRFA